MLTIQLLLPIAAILSFFICPSTADLPTLLSALQSSGASRFAQVIENDPTLTAFFVSSDVQTVYAPADPCDDDEAAAKKRQQTPAQERAARHQTEQKQDHIKDVAQAPNIDTPEGAVVPMSSTNSSSGSTKRWMSPLPRRDVCNGTTRASLLTLFSGLGNNVSVIQADIQYDGGIIHIVDDYFTLPSPLSVTAAADGHTTFLSLLNTTNTTSTLDTASKITVFIPRNAAFASASSSNASSPYATPSSLLQAHVITGFIGYLPLLKNGAVFATQGGGNVSITTGAGGAVFVNNARIVAPNLVLSNGVAHVVDQIVTPIATPKPTTVVTSAGSRMVQGSAVGAVMLSGAVAFGVLLS